MLCESEASRSPSHPSPTCLQTKVKPEPCPWPSPLGESQHPLLTSSGLRELKESAVVSEETESEWSRL